MHATRSLPRPRLLPIATRRVARGGAGLPDVFVVGAAKSGTTALYRFFQSHPQVFVPATLKETNYMAFHGGLPPLAGPRDRQCVGRSITSLADYRRLYADRTQEAAAADVSPAYLYYPHAATRIAALVPSAKIVIILRNPVECVLSMYSMMRRNGREPCRSPWTAFQQSDRRMAAGWEWAWDYKHGYQFSGQVARYLERFPPEQLFIRRYEELQRDPQRFYRQLTAFLGVSMIDLAESNQRVNSAPRRIDMLRQKRAGRLICRAAEVLGHAVPAQMAEAVRRRFEAPAFTLNRRERRRLVDHFGPDILRLSEILSWDLSEWLRV